MLLTTLQSMFDSVSRRDSLLAQARESGACKRLRCIPPADFVLSLVACPRCQDSYRFCCAPWRRWKSAGVASGWGPGGGARWPSCSMGPASSTCWPWTPRRWVCPPAQFSPDEVAALYRLQWEILPVRHAARGCARPRYLCQDAQGKVRHRALS